MLASSLKWTPVEQLNQEQCAVYQSIVLVPYSLQKLPRREWSHHKSPFHPLPELILTSVKHSASSYTSPPHLLFHLIVGVTRTMTELFRFPQPSRSYLPLFLLPLQFSA